MRTGWVGRAALVLFSLVMAATGYAAGSVWDRVTQEHAGVRDITVYRSASCGCCKGWIEHLHRHDFVVQDVLTEEMGAVKTRLGVPSNVASCHTAVIDGYLIEGHVPADDIKRLLRERPQVAGLAVPQMPVGTPGMEMGERKDSFAVVHFQKDGSFDAYREYWHY